MADTGRDEFTPAQLEQFFHKGEQLVEEIVLPALKEAPSEGLVVDYGCGAGRVLRALTRRNVNCAGIDISATMLQHCRRLVPEVSSLHVLDQNGRSSLPDGCARVAYSYAVLQHISRLSVFERAVGEICRLVMPGGLVAIHVTCRDFEGGWTLNFERLSVYPRRGWLPFPRRHTNWNGVCIGSKRMMSLLESFGLVPFAPVKFRDWSAIFFAKRPS
jgi:SAM-dependent methyltransferase